MIRFQSVSKSYAGNPVLHDINLELPKGKIIAFVGASGAGKSTLLQCINALVQPDQGEVMLDGLDLASLDKPDVLKMRKNIGMVFQHFNLLETRTALENVMLPLELEALSPVQRKQQALELLTRVGLADRVDNYPNGLSGGQKQRVAIARALATKPEILLCDEMTSALDPATTLEILQLLRDIQEEQHLSVFMVTHEMGVVKQIADAVVLLDQGKLIEYSDVLDFFAKPQTQLAREQVIKGLHLEIPEPIKARLLRGEFATAESKLLRLTFVGEQSCAPIISDLSRSFKISSSILQADIEYMRDVYLGFTLCEVSGKSDAINAAIANLEEQGVHVEVVDA